ncbi:MAG: hypothetical protein GKS06_14080 [Acidobacteria bacterium]|nr:hypothetical protein [Acidobacteriota bacterium]
MIKKAAFVAHPTWDIEKSKQFYGEVLGMQHDHDYDGGWCEYVLPDGTTVALDTYGPKMIGDQARTYLSLEIDDLDAYVGQLEAAGVEFVLPLTINNNEEGREICRMAVILDPDKNPIMLHQKAAWRD